MVDTFFMQVLVTLQKYNVRTKDNIFSTDPVQLFLSWGLVAWYDIKRKTFVSSRNVKAAWNTASFVYLNLIYYFFGDEAEAVADAIEMLPELP